jgi:hypothetical protein
VEVEVWQYGKYFGFMVKVEVICVCSAACGNAESRVLNGLKFVDGSRGGYG